MLWAIPSRAVPSGETRRNRIGVVYQFFNLIPTLDVLENVMLVHELVGRNRGEANRRAGEAKRRAGEELERVGLQ